MPYADPEKERENQKKRSARYRKTDKYAATLERWQESVGREYKRKWVAEKRKTQPKQIRPLTDCYIRDTLTKRSAIHRSDIPQAMVEIYREHLTLKRELRK